ncbi:Aste57867_19985 [Aphanomyces stellatus]|uniref:Aste57867_19985 protein n=1 Tax=Aphanomyces stellatus TaxID=120398 RepID=A0A485LDY6_9STRA|nr:hypothetical protein As57867_019919 [Aphanomyces stellatus]VFT96682.1 Aste57867_19985 [Aphanomyces stellatus]
MFTSPNWSIGLTTSFAHRVWHACPIGEQRICHTSTKPTMLPAKSSPSVNPFGTGQIIHGCLDRFLDKSPGYNNLAKACDTLVSDIRIQLKEFHTQRVDKQRLPMKKLAFEIAALLEAPNMRQDPVLVGRVRDLQQQVEKLQTTQKEFRQEQAFKLHLYKAERSSKFHFMSPVPSPLKKTVFKEMEDSDGNLVSSQNGISNVLVDYYSGLFAPLSSRPLGDDLSSFLIGGSSSSQRVLPRHTQKQLKFYRLIDCDSGQLVQCRSVKFAEDSVPANDKKVQFNDQITTVPLQDYPSENVEVEDEEDLKAMSTHQQHSTQVSVGAPIVDTDRDPIVSSQPSEGQVSGTDHEEHVSSDQESSDSDVEPENPTGLEAISGGRHQVLSVDTVNDAPQSFADIEASPNKQAW